MLVSARLFLRMTRGSLGRPGARRTPVLGTSCSWRCTLVSLCVCMCRCFLIYHRLILWRQRGKGLNPSSATEWLWMFLPLLSLSFHICKVGTATPSLQGVVCNQGDHKRKLLCLVRGSDHCVVVITLPAASGSHGPPYPWSSRGKHPWRRECCSRGTRGPGTRKQPLVRTVSQGPRRLPAWTSRSMKSQENQGSPRRWKSQTGHQRSKSSLWIFFLFF